jgi:ParB family chromosome partitioning protein
MEPATTDGAPSGGTLLEIPIERLAPHPYQPRQRFDETEIDSLSASIREKGIIQPLVVRPTGDGESYQIVAGERRWRAAQKAGLHAVPAVVRRLTDAESLEIALVENLQRRDLDPLEEAEAYRRLMQEFNHRQEDVAAALGKSRSHVANTVRLLELPDEVKTLVGERIISAGHARALLTSPKALELAQEVVRRKLNVRQTEALVRKAEVAPANARSGAAGPQKDPNLVALQEEISRELGLKVVISPRSQGGQLTITYQAPEQLDAIIGRLRKSARL